MIVVDASAVVLALAYGDGRGDRARAVLASDPEWVVPEHWTVEVFAAVRGLTLGGSLSPPEGAEVLGRLRALTVESVGVADLLAAMWSMRENVSGYDAGYLALAATRGLSLVTADHPLGRAAVGHCRVELI